MRIVSLKLRWNLNSMGSSTAVEQAVQLGPQHDDSLEMR
jgi:hypothetical protein